MNKEILIIGNFNDLKTRPDKLDYNFFEYLKKKSIYKIHLNEVNDKNNDIILQNKNVIIIVFTSKPNILPIYSKYKKIYWVYDLNCKCSYKCDSLKEGCKFKPQIDYIYDNNFNYIWYKYETYITNTLNNLFPNKCFKFPHTHFNNEIHYDYNLEKKYDILFYGATYKEVYPFRFRLYHLLNKNKHKYNILFLPYTKRKPHKMTTGIELYKKISQSWLTISCCSINNVLVSKYYEIGLCGSVVCGDYPELESEKYIKENMIYININMSDNEILNIIDSALKNKSKLLEYSKNTKNYLSKNYMYNNGLELFEKYLSNL